MEEVKKVPVKRSYRVSLFGMIFRNKKELLELYNAVNGTKYTDPDLELSLELKAVMLNINPGKNEALKEACKTLKDYTEYTWRVSQYAETMPLEDVVEQAIGECIQEGILKEFLSKNRAEAKSVSIYEYDEARHIRQTKEEGREEGRLSAIADAIQICADLGASRENAISQIVQKYGLPQEKVEEMVGECWK
ncbi:MAG: hypothetical protein ACI4S0_10140 [Dorea sp.]